MQQLIVDQAQTLGFNVYQNAFGQWVIRGMIDRKMWVLHEHRQNSWLVTFGEFSPMSLCAEKTLEALTLLTKHTNKQSFS
ncbi:MAG: hypothetical protein QNJ34_06895 [Xenococcaceae cyanobacterium MO_188.B29]|nr:hypothetical protein [Xenococcaceae cyanobacterium MO_188.B29]